MSMRSSEMTSFIAPSRLLASIESLDDLLAAYRPDDYFLAFPSGAWLGQGVACSAAAERRSHLDRARASEALERSVAALFEEARAKSGVRAPIVMGAVPFDVRAPARLVVPRVVRRAASRVSERSVGPARKAVEVPHTSPHALSPEPPREVYEASVARALERFERGELEKVVLARSLAVDLQEPPNRPALMRRLTQRNTRGYTYAVPLEDARDAALQGRAEPVTFIGASPELLVRRVGSRVVLNPLAGSTGRRDHPAEDKRAALALLHSDKDRREHALLIDAVAETLRPLCRALDVPTVPSVIATDSLWHLSTTLVGELADPSMSSLHLALALHPTPAVCGVPLEPAMATIAELEPFDRGLFAGFVGWCDAHGDGEWSVSLRCAELSGSRVRLYAGAGIVPGSIPTSEATETGLKFRTMLQALSAPSL
ncbi:MAG TPA: isochorismate synthase [Labilithrix sp.]|nr:isochorismate synthase [Labilithrix sp.]